MNKTVYQIKEIAVKDYSRKENRILLGVKFTKNDILDELTEACETTNSAGVVNNIFLKIKSKDKIIVEEESDDILSSIYIARIANEDEIEEKMLAFFSKLFDKVRSLKHETVASRYLNTIDNIKHEKLVL